MLYRRQTSTNDLNRAVNVLAVDTLRRLYNSPYGRICTAGYVWVHTQAYFGSNCKCTYVRVDLQVYVST